jgi:hypothetical protein
MKRNVSKTDFLTLIGMMATIAGIFVCLFFLFTPVAFGAMETQSPIDRSLDLQLAMRWIQPILGQAIVEDALIRDRSQQTADTGQPRDGFTKPAYSSVQWMVGRVIVELNRSRVAGSDDQRIVTIARHAAEQLL